MARNKTGGRTDDPFEIGEHIDPNVDAPPDGEKFSPEPQVAPKRDPNAPLSAGDMLLGRYKIIKLIGRGGMGFVYQAQETGLDRYVAIKVFPPQFAMDENLVQRFETEVRIASNLDHPNIVPIYFVGQDEGLTFFVMKYLNGRTLAQRVREEGPLLPEMVIQVAIQTLGALDYAHSRGTVHRDIKPGNIMLGPDGLVSLMDFGIARSLDTASVTRPGEIVGTAEYMSPEQWNGEVDKRSDLYSLGIVLYECLTGRPPFCDMPIPALMKSHLSEQPTSLAEKRQGLPEGLDPAVLRLLRKTPDERFKSAREAQDSFYALLRQPPQRGAEAQLSITQAARQSLAASLAGEPQTVPMELPTGVRDFERMTSLMDRAEALYNKGELQRAVGLLEQARQLSPNDDTLLHRLDTYQSVERLINGLMARAQKLIKDGQLARAESELDKILQCYQVPKAERYKRKVLARRRAAEQAFVEGRRAERSGRTSLARRRYRRCVQLSPDRSDAVFRLKFIDKTRANRWRWRGRVLRRAVVVIALVLVFGVGGAMFVKDPVGVLMPRAEKSFAARRWVSPPLYNAARLYRLVLTFDDKNELAQQRLQMMEDTFLRQARQAEHEKDFQTMLQAYRSALYVDPDDPDLRSGLEQAQNAVEIQKSFE